jgi:hypothetical protein
MFKIVGIYDGLEPEIMDTYDSIKEARSVLADYLSMATGTKWRFHIV